MPSSESWRLTGAREHPFLARAVAQLDAFRDVSGMYKTSRWLVLEDLVALLKDLGMAEVEVVEMRDERNGPRVLLLARR